MKINKLIATGACYATVALVSTLYGMAIVKYKIPPHETIRIVRQWIHGNNAIQQQPTVEIAAVPVAPESPETPKHYFETDVDSLISISKVSDVAETRLRLITFLWGDNGLPANLPTKVESDIADDRYRDIDALESIDKLVFVMEYGIESVAYHFKPKVPNEKLVLFHQGHRGDFSHSKHQIQVFLDHGFDVVAFAMPLLGMNNQPEIALPRLGKLKLTSHEQIRFLTPSFGHPIQYFLSPVTSTLNYLAQMQDFTSISAVGISGGGWTITLAAAIDPRIDYSFPVAGSYPIYLRSDSQKDWGDYEQTTPELYRTVNYLELYILGSVGERRMQVQMINHYDSCCFAGSKWNTYEGAVKKRIDALGAGSFDIFTDFSHRKHQISDVAVYHILNVIEIADQR